MNFEGNVDSLNQMCQTGIEIPVDKKSSFEPQNPAENPDLAHFFCHSHVCIVFCRAASTNDF
jgi:hypothetical protein